VEESRIGPSQGISAISRRISFTPCATSPRQALSLVPRGRSSAIGGVSLPDEQRRRHCWGLLRRSHRIIYRHAKASPIPLVTSRKSFAVHRKRHVASTLRELSKLAL